MKDEHVTEELSAYLDGVARDPDGIRRHMEECAECRQRHAALSEVVARVGSLEAPEVGASFRAGVMSSVSELRCGRRVSWLRVGFATVAALVVLAALSGLAWLPGARPSGGHYLALRHTGLMAELERRASAAPGYLEWVALDATGEDFLTAQVVDDAEELIDVVAWASWFEALAEAVDAEQELDALVGALDEEETAALKRLLDEY